MTELLLGAITCAFVLGMGAWAVSVHRRITRLEALREHDDADR